MREPDCRMLVEHLASTDSPEDIGQLLELLLTPREINDICDRLKIYRLLVDGRHSQRAIAKLAGVSISKVERGAANARSPAVQAYFRRHFPLD